VHHVEDTLTRLLDADHVDSVEHVDWQAGAGGRPAFS
jgi:hypothetical protein